jgi:ferritin-like metal-binding protein YciE
MLQEREAVMKLESLEDLYVDQWRDLYNAESQLIKALPKMAKAASAGDLKNAFEEHLEQTRLQANRLEEIFGKLGKKAGGKKCQAMEGLIEEGKELSQEDAEEAVRDAGLIAAAQKVEHYEIAGYGCVCTWAERLGRGDEAQLLRQTLDEEKRTDEKLTRLAEGGVNDSAREAARMA